LTVMQIQQSHFFTVDLFVNTFAFLALLFAVAILEYKEKRIEEPQPDLEAVPGEPLENDLKPATTNFSLGSLQQTVINPLVFFSIAFGLALGMAMASK